MAKICPFLESKADIFSRYLPVSDINLAIEKNAFGTASPVPVVVCASCLHLRMILFRTISFFVVVVAAFVRNRNVRRQPVVITVSEKHLKNSC